MNDRPMTRPASRHLHAVDEVIGHFLEMVMLAALDPFHEVTVMGHVQQTPNALIGNESRPILLRTGTNFSTDSELDQLGSTIEMPADLADVIVAWPSLSRDARAAIVRIAR